MSKIEHTVEHTIDTNIATIESSELTAVHGGDNNPNQPVGYNAQDVKNAADGAKVGSRFGLPGALTGGALGFMSRNLKNLASAGGDYIKEVQRGHELDKQIELRRQAKPPGANPMGGNPMGGGN